MSKYKEANSWTHKPKALKLQPGLVYVRRDGNTTEPLEETKTGLVYDPRFGIDYYPSHKGFAMGSQGHSQADLVAEVAENPPAISYGSDKQGAAASLALEVLKELKGATEAFPPFNSLHEGMSILHEEVDELWEEVKKKQSDPKRAALAKREATQVAAMALRLILDCCEEEGKGYGK